MPHWKVIRKLSGNVFNYSSLSDILAQCHQCGKVMDNYQMTLGDSPNFLKVSELPNLFFL